jgi:hypothetical protein
MRNTHFSWQIYHKIALIRFKVGLVSPYFGLFKFNKNPTASDRHKYFSQTCHSSATGKLENYCSLKAEILIFSWTVDILMVFFYTQGYRDDANHLLHWVCHFFDN